MSNRGGAPRHMQKRNTMNELNGRAIQLPSEQQRIAAAQNAVENIVGSTSQLIYAQLAAMHLATLEPEQAADNAELRRFAARSRHASLFLAEACGFIQVQDAPPAADETAAPAATDQSAETDKPDEPSNIIIP